MKIERDFFVTQVAILSQREKDEDTVRVVYSVGVGALPTDVDMYPDTFDLEVTAQEASLFQVGQAVKVTFETAQ